MFINVFDLSKNQFLFFWSIFSHGYLLFFITFCWKVASESRPWDWVWHIVYLLKTGSCGREEAKTSLFRGEKLWLSLKKLRAWGAFRGVLHWSEMSGTIHFQDNHSLHMSCPRRACPWIRKFSATEADPGGAGEWIFFDIDEASECTPLDSPPFSF